MKMQSAQQIQGTLKRAAHVPVAVFDGHCDSLILRELNDDPMDLFLRAPAYQADGPRLRRGGVTGLFVMVGDKDVRQSLRLIDAVYRMAQAHPEGAAVCLLRAEVLKARRSGRLALVMSIEGQSMFADDLALLRLWHRLGVRVMSLTHGEGRRSGPPTALQYADAYFGLLPRARRALLYRQSKGLTAFARAALREMGALRLVVDLAHANDRAFYEALECAPGPVAVTHANTYALCPHTRNLTDEMMRALAARGGVLGLCPYERFIDPEKPSVARLADHVLHALEVMGADHVGFGSDLDGLCLHEQAVFPEATGIPLLWDELDRRGLSRAVIRKIAGDNFIRLLP